jgi:hypothetical protein
MTELQTMPAYVLPAKALRAGDFVVTPDGSVGLLSEIKLFEKSTVQFGASGPYQQWDWKTLRHATLREVNDAGLVGVGGRILGDNWS